MSYLRRMPSKTTVRRICALDCAATHDHTESLIGLNAFSGKDVDRELARRRKKGRIRKIELIS